MAFTLRSGAYLGIMALGLVLASHWQPAAAQTAPQPTPLVEDLGDGIYRLGQITVNKPGRSFSLPGKIIDLGMADMPLEFLAVAKDGAKGYESILELEASAIEFNLACILIGLDDSHAVAPRGHFDPTPANGDPIELRLTLATMTGERDIPISAILKLPDEAPVTDEWVYTGSYFLPDGQYAAQLIGLLIGFVHDRESIIQHRTGLGLERYGTVTFRASQDILPGMPFTLTVSRPQD